MNNDTQRSGVGVFGCFFLVLFILKIIGQIDWSWWWVTAPIWCPLALGGVFLVLGRIVAGIAKLFGRG